MTTLSIPINSMQEEFINYFVKSKQAANKADAVRKAINLMAEEELLASVLRAEQEYKEGKVLYGDPRKLLKKFSKYD
jgi:Arc/MetJ-type ribon-helix-helix transcriptional regulator